ncbi:hypothetical protein [Cellulomonas soli]
MHGQGDVVGDDMKRAVEPGAPAGDRAVPQELALKVGGGSGCAGRPVTGNGVGVDRRGSGSRGPGDVLHLDAMA